MVKKTKAIDRVKSNSIKKQIGTIEYTIFNSSTAKSISTYMLKAQIRAQRKQEVREKVISWRALNNIDSKKTY